MTDLRSESKLIFNLKNFKGTVQNQLKYLYYGIVSLALIGLALVAVITAPIWISIILFNLPLLIILGYLFMYTNVSR
jgi:uncharacterized membrane-anchored protein YitT (DUF2179 family)